MKLTRIERWILTNQMEILAHVDPENADHYEKAREVLTSGYTLAYGWYCPPLEEELSEEACQEVMDILDMFRAIKRATAAGLPAEVEEWELEFHGFDGNNEAEQVGFARFLIEDGRWQEHADAGDGLNSHGPTLDRYRGMLRRWRLGGRGFDLAEGDLVEIAKAGRRGGARGGE